MSHHLTSVKGFYSIGPYKIENRVIFVNRDRVSKHALGIVLVELEELGSLLVLPVILFE